MQIIPASNIYTNSILQPFTGPSQKEPGYNCPAAEVISSKVNCERALQSLGLRLMYDVSRTDRPAGCYWKSDDNGFFNNIIDPSLTDPNSFGDRGGVCMTMRKNC